MCSKRSIGILVAGLLVLANAWGDVRLPTVFSHGMVLQRDSKFSVWGWADPGEEIRLVFQEQNFRARADRNGHWSVSIGPYSAGGPYELIVGGKNTLMLRDILVGDVWLASGQSNMAWPVRSSSGAAINHSDWEVARSDFPQIRLFSVQHSSSNKPRMDVNSEGWRAVTPESIVDFSAVAYLFGRELHERYHVPIGLINSSCGGAVAEAWMSEHALRRFPEFHGALELLAQVDSRAQAAYDSYIKRKAAWYKQHGSEDRGRVGERDVWAKQDLDTSRWPTVSVPQSWNTCGQELNGFSGVVWYRRAIQMPPEHAGKALLLRLGTLIQDGTAYFNGEKIGETSKESNGRESYVVPANYVRQGQNTIAIRIIGSESRDLPGTCMVGPELEMSAEIGNSRVSLAGTWSYQPGPDLRDFPVADAITRAAFPSRYSPTGLFNAMLKPLTRFRIKGVIWYQGESNADRPEQYRTLFPALIQDWRRQWGYEVPLLFVQLAGFGPNRPEPAEYLWADLREAQAMALSLPRTGMATAIDVGDENDIHPRNKQDVAHRLALAAASIAYDENLVHTGPMYQSMEIEGDRIRIKFTNVGTGLLIKDKYGYGRGFEIAAGDGKFYWAQAKTDGQDIVVFSKSVRAPSAVRYNWSNTPDGNVFNREGLPAPPFRTSVSQPRSHEAATPSTL